VGGTGVSAPVVCSVVACAVAEVVKSAIGSEVGGDEGVARAVGSSVVCTDAVLSLHVPLTAFSSDVTERGTVLSPLRAHRPWIYVNRVHWGNATHSAAHPAASIVSRPDARSPPLSSMSYVIEQCKAAAALTSVCAVAPHVPVTTSVCSGLLITPTTARRNVQSPSSKL